MVVLGPGEEGKVATGDLINAGHGSGDGLSRGAPHAAIMMILAECTLLGSVNNALYCGCGVVGVALIWQSVRYIHGKRLPACLLMPRGILVELMQEVSFWCAQRNSIRHG